MQTENRPKVLRQMAIVRRAFRSQREARAHRRAWLFYLEHNLFDEARTSRILMLERLRGACGQWRLALGTDR